MNGDGGSAGCGEGGGSKAMSPSAAAAAASSEKLRKSSGNSSSGASIREEKWARSRSSQVVENYSLGTLGSNWRLEVIGVIGQSMESVFAVFNHRGVMSCESCAFNPPDLQEEQLRVHADASNDAGARRGRD